MQKRKLTLMLLLAIGLVWLSTTTAVFAHGATIAYETRNTTVVEIQATFDTGEPMAHGQVAIFAPDDPLNPWQTGTCDEQGRFSFVPDPSKPGTWEIQVRQAGHGDIVYVEITDEQSGEVAAMNASLAGGATVSQSQQPGSNGYTPLQIVLMGGCVTWGFVGTALFFAKRKQKQEKNNDAHS
jgi:nickel transport protein